MKKILIKGFYKTSCKIEELQKIFLKSRKNKTLILLILLSGVLCLHSILFQDIFYVQTGQELSDNWIETSITGSNKLSLSVNIQKKEQVLKNFSNFYLPEKKGEETKNSLETELINLVGEAPIKEMIQYISNYDREIAGLIIGIAKKESDWGRRAPSKNGEDCYNYWGYKGIGSSGTVMGYACFESAEEAVRIVGGRIAYFVNKKINTPSKMVIWKCGSSCAWDNPANVQKWILDVSKYYNQIAYARAR